MRAIRRLKQLAGVMLALLVLAPWSAEAARDNKEKETDKAPKRSAAAVAAAERIYGKEQEALAQAEKLMIEVVDEKSAIEVSRRLCKIFNPLPAPMGGSDKQLEALAKSQNVISRKMEKLRRESWFVSSGLQDAWSIITVPSMRRRATNSDK